MTDHRERGLAEYIDGRASAAEYAELRYREESAWYAGQAWERMKRGQFATASVALFAAASYAAWAGVLSVVTGSRKKNRELKP